MSPSALHNEPTRRASTDTPLPSLPMELKREILRFCDQDTLAKTSRVSLAFLELCSALLYRDVALQGTRGLDRMFCRSRDRQHTVSPFLDLQQIKSLTLDLTAEELEISYLALTTDRVSSIALGNVEGVLAHVQDVTLLLDSTGLDEGDAYDIQALLSVFNPTNLIVQGYASEADSNDKDYGSDGDDQKMPYLDLPTGLPWTLLRSIAFLDCGPERHLRQSLLLSCKTPVIIAYDLAGRVARRGLPYGCDPVANALDDLLGGWALAYEPFDERYSLVTSPNVKKVVFRVNGKDLTYLEMIIRATWESEGIEMSKRESWATLIEFERVDSGTKRTMALTD